MNFTTPEFLLFFPPVLLGYRLLPAKWRPWFLLLVSYLFYMYFNPWTVLLLFAATGVTWAAGLGIEGAKSNAVRRRWLAAALAVCLGCLVVFKYLGFLEENLQMFVRLFGGSMPPLPALLLPVGISFYTFQGLSYVIDVYRKKIRAERNPGYYALFLAFFPQLVAGPIERPQELLPQLVAAKTPVREDFETGGWLMARGFFKKLAVADQLSLLVESVYGNPSVANGPAVFAATVAFAFQIYGDFSGYSDIAQGAARMLGIRLTDNFRQPYLAHSLRDFWRRWHISLTGWFTDYLYIPLGGSRCSTSRNVSNVVLVFMVSGLWHGAAWNYVAWGMLHGVMLGLETCLRRMAGVEKRKAADQLFKKRAWCPGLLRFAAWFRTFVLVCLAWIFFRAPNIGDAVLLLRALIQGWSEAGLADAWGQLALTGDTGLSLLIGLFCMALMDQRPALWPRTDFKSATGRSLVMFALILAIAVSWVVLLSADMGSAFLYFQF